MNVNIQYGDEVVAVSVNEGLAVYDNAWVPVQQATGLEVTTYQTVNTEFAGLPSVAIVHAVTKWYPITSSAATAVEELYVRQQPLQSHSGHLETAEQFVAPPVVGIAGASLPALELTTPFTTHTFEAAPQCEKDAISSGDWTGASALGRYTAAEPLTIGDAVTLRPDGTVVKARNSQVIGFVAATVGAGGRVQVLSGVNKIAAWPALVVGAVYRTDSAGELSTDPANAYLGLAIGVDAMLFGALADGGSAPSVNQGTIRILNTGAETLTYGMFVSITPSGLIKSSGTVVGKNTVGMVVVGGSTGALITIMSVGVVDIDVSLITSDSFEPGDPLYLSTTDAGRLVTSVDENSVAAGSYVVRVGTVVTAASIRIDIQESVGV